MTVTPEIARHVNLGQASLKRARSDELTYMPAGITNAPQSRPKGCIGAEMVLAVDLPDHVASLNRERSV